MVDEDGEHLRCNSWTLLPGEDEGKRFLRQRYEVRERKVKIYLEPSALVERMRTELYNIERKESMLASAYGRSFATLSAESLDSFEYAPDGEDKVAASVRAWAIFLNSWGVTANDTKIERIIREGGPEAPEGSRHDHVFVGGNVGQLKRKELADVVSNFAEVKKALLDSDDARLVALVTPGDPRSDREVTQHQKRGRLSTRSAATSGRVRADVRRGWHAKTACTTPSLTTKLTTTTVNQFVKKRVIDCVPPRP